MATNRSPNSTFDATSAKTTRLKNEVERRKYDCQRQLKSRIPAEHTLFDLELNKKEET